MSDLETAIVMFALGISMLGIGIIFGFLFSLKKIAHLNRTLAFGAEEFWKQDKALDEANNRIKVLVERNMSEDEFKICEKYKKEK